MKRFLLVALVGLGLMGMAMAAGAATPINNWCTSTYQLTGLPETTALGSDSAVVSRQTRPALSVTKIATNIRTNDTQDYSVNAIVGDTVQFKIMWVNTGEADADTIVLYDYVPANMALIAGSAADTESADATGAVTEVSATLIRYTGNSVDGTDSTASTGAFWFKAIVQ